MLSFSDNEFAVLNYLVRNVRERLSVRGISQKLGFSPAGVYNILKKFEEQDLVFYEKFGTGLFYQINLENKAAWYLSVLVLGCFYKRDFDVSSFSEKVLACVYDGKKMLVITDNSDLIPGIDVDGVEVMKQTQQVFVESLRTRKKDVISMIQKGTVLFGEDEILRILSLFIERF